MLKYIKSLFSYSVGVWLSALISFFTSPIISYLVIPEEFGKALMFTAVYNILMLVSQIGLNESFLRFFYEVDDEEKGSLLGVCFLPSIFILILISYFLVSYNQVVSNMIVGKQDPGVVYILIFSIFFGIVGAYEQRIIRINRKGLLFSTIYTIQTVSNSSLTIILLSFYRRNYTSLLLAQLGSNIITAMIGLIFTYKLWFSLRFNKKIFHIAIKYGLPLLPSGLLIWLFTWIDRVSLRMFSNFYEIGLYSAAFKLVSIINLFGTGFFQFWQPIMFEKIENENDNFFRKALEIVSLFVSILSILAISVSDVVFLLFEKSYREAARVAPFLALGTSIQIIGYIIIAGIEYSKKTIWYSITLLMSSVFNFVMNFILIRFFGAKGAAIATGFSHLLLFYIRLFVSNRFLKIVSSLNKLTISFLILILQAFIVSFVNQWSISLLTGAILIVLLISVNWHVFNTVIGNLRIELRSKMKHCGSR